MLRQYKNRLYDAYVEEFNEDKDAFTEKLERRIELLAAAQEAFTISHSDYNLLKHDIEIAMLVCAESECGV